MRRAIPRPGATCNGTTRPPPAARLASRRPAGKIGAVLAKVLTCAVVGLDGALVEVEVDIGPGLPAFQIVGLGDTAIQEARERVRAAIRNSGCAFPNRHPYPW